MSCCRWWRLEKHTRANERANERTQKGKCRNREKIERKNETGTKVQKSGAISTLQSAPTMCHADGENTIQDKNGGKSAMINGGKRISLRC